MKAQTLRKLAIFFSVIAALCLILCVTGVSVHAWDKNMQGFGPKEEGYEPSTFARYATSAAWAAALPLFVSGFIAAIVWVQYDGSKDK